MPSAVKNPMQSDHAAMVLKDDKGEKCTDLPTKAMRVVKKRNLRMRMSNLSLFAIQSLARRTGKK